ncbi:hypothetical protein J3F84DRAFT_369056 [Trichoderma pleuroticola]
MARKLSISSASSWTLHKWTEANLCRPVVFHHRALSHMTAKRKQSIQYIGTSPVSSAEKQE